MELGRHASNEINNKNETSAHTQENLFLFSFLLFLLYSFTLVCSPEPHVSPYCAMFPVIASRLYVCHDLLSLTAWDRPFNLTAKPMSAEEIVARQGYGSVLCGQCDYRKNTCR
ncbi:hypothetical protein BDZ91DRAFT_731457 [Kalaharituber pfeilii]|nr:hypothetical protein BDZ91DRAFT_731457 [Kalaharituber pfeilii]